MLPLTLLKWKSRDVSPRVIVLLFQPNPRSQLISLLFCPQHFPSIFGENIHCQLDGHKVSQSFLDTKCFINGTLTNFSGVENPILPVLYHDYYQWVSIVLFYKPFPFIYLSTVFQNPSFLCTRVDYSESEPSEYDRVFQVIAPLKAMACLETMTLECVYAAHLLCQIVLLNVFFHRVCPYPAGPVCHSNVVSGHGNLPL
ncbi:innexin [Trichonephila clavata]|uniref:Innexin n=1 Tax=Trichonephila clavata TaxID=2740835 RepID=A0A8X6H267_TRICU|nr:innexin [Trichonephila clavata]